MDYFSLSCFLKSLSGCELVALSGIISVSISKGLSSEELSILASFISAIGDNLAIIASSDISGNLC